MPPWYSKMRPPESDNLLLASVTHCPTSETCAELVLVDSRVQSSLKTGVLLHTNLGKPAMALLNKLAERASPGGVVFKEGFVVTALRAPCVVLCRGNCVLYMRSLYALARAGCNAFHAGTDVPTSQGSIACFLSL